MRIDRRFLVVLCVSLVWALVVTALFTRLTRGVRATRGAGREQAVVVAARALPLGAVIARDAVQLRDVPEKLFPSGGFSKVEDVLDRPVTSNIQPGEPVLEARLAARGSGVGLAPLIPPGMRAISVRVNDVVGVAGFVLPGMRVDVLVTGHPSNRPDAVTRTVLQNIVVLSAGQTIQTDGKNAISAPVVTLLVTPDDAEALTLANIEGRIQLVLRNTSDERVATPPGRQWNELYGAAGSGPAPSGISRSGRERKPVESIAPTTVKVPAVPADPKPADPVMVIRGAVKTIEVAGKGGAR